MSPGRIIAVLFWTKYVARQIKPKIFKLIIERGRSKFGIIFITVSFEEKDYYCVVWVGQLSFDCRSYCGRSCRMQGNGCRFTVLAHNWLRLPWSQVKNTLLIVNCLPLPRLFFVHVTGERFLTWSTWFTSHGVDVSVLCFSVTIGRGGGRPLPSLSSRELGKVSILKFPRLGFL